MYKVYRCIDGIPQKLLAECATLENARQHAQRLTRAERKPSMEYRILGPSAAPPSDHDCSTSSEREAPRHIWFRADGSVAPVHAVTSHPGPVSPRRQTVAQEGKKTSSAQLGQSSKVEAPTKRKRLPRGVWCVVRYSAGHREIVSRGFRDPNDATKLALSFIHDPVRKDRELYVVVEYAMSAKIPVGIPPHKTTRVKRRYAHPKRHLAGYVVARVKPPEHEVITESLATLEETWEAARPCVRMNTHDDVLYIVERRGLALPVTDAPYTPADLRAEEEDGEKYPWELEDRRGDMSLITHRSDELGLGAPAQFGKGRRSRKGNYIP